MHFQILLCFLFFKLNKGDEMCEHEACYHSLGDLLIGRSSQLSATSTCGLNEPQKYCIIGYLEDEQKCFTCDSRHHYPYSQMSHRIENVITTFEPDRKKKWWQSENGVDEVSIQLDLEALFQFSHLILTFKSFRPAAMLVERSTDSGKTWKVFRYFAQDCTSAFPNIPVGQAHRVEDVVCDQRYSDVEPSSGGEVVLKALDPTFEIKNPYSPNIQDIITLTNLRINFTKLHTLGDTLLGRRTNDLIEKYYYAVYEMVVRGSCYCNGHASQCVPVERIRGDIFSQEGMVHGRCVCQHNTDGVNCEKCKDFYNDAPWRPAEGTNINPCKACMCNGHSNKCHFDMAVFQANNGVSGGVCDDCQHNTMGQYCEQCKPYFYQDPLRHISDPHACIPCNCDPDGTLHGGICESQTDLELQTIAGRCPCKENVEGLRCDHCKSGYFGISDNDHLGCQTCRCNQLGSLPSSTCDPVTGECYCQRFARGRFCEECHPGYWGLGLHPHGCLPCDCDIGGAYNDLCSSADGQCKCLPNIIGRQCNEPSPGYFFAPLNYYLYEAEEAKPLGDHGNIIVEPTRTPDCHAYFLEKGYDFQMQDGKIVLKQMEKQSEVEKRQIQQQNTQVEVVYRQPTPEKPITWTGPGFARVLNGMGLRFIVNNIPYTMDYFVAIRYEPESTDDWLASIVVNQEGSPKSERCISNYILPETHRLDLPASARLAILKTPVCLEPEVQYFIDITFTQSSGSTHRPDSYILVDSIGLIPKIDSLENFCKESDHEALLKYQCIEAGSEVGVYILPDTCKRLIASMSARIHNGAVPCRCNLMGSLSPSCNKFGGQCPCKANVVGRCCDTCAVGSYGFGPAGCFSCECDPRGSFSTICDQVTGQCACRAEVHGRRCDQCQPGYFGFPNCQPCQCNSFADLCDQQTGICLNCRAHTTGINCERCESGYYGDPLSGQTCQPCLCPDTPTSGRYFASSCYQEDTNSLEVFCICLQGYTGKHCDECPSGHYGVLKQVGDQCLPCPCNNNIDISDPESCDRVTGECLKCLYNTHGPNCQSCTPGYYRSAHGKGCTKCACNMLGTNRRMCQSHNGECVCDPETGQCPCVPNVIGTICDQCDFGYWNMNSRNGCQKCACNPKNSLGNQCNQLTGQCPCKVGYGGKTCEECQDGFYGNPHLQCNSCNCNLQGTLRPTCDKITGACICKSGVTGEFCNQCAREFYQEFPKCELCHPCFDKWDKEISSISRAINWLINASSELKQQQLKPEQEKRLKELEDKLNEINTICTGPILSTGFKELQQFLDRIRQLAKQLDQNITLVDNIPALKETIEEIKKEAETFYSDIQKKFNFTTITNSTAINEAYKAILRHYKESGDAQKKVSDSDPILIFSKNTRNKTSVLLRNASQEAGSYQELLKKTESLDINYLNSKICGAPGNLSCHQAACGGALCRDDDGNRMCGGPNCNGISSLADKAFSMANNSNMLVSNLLTQLYDSEKQTDNIRQMAKDSNVKASQLVEKLTQAKAHFEDEMEQLKDLIRKVKNFLTEGASPEDIEKVANYVLSINLPVTNKTINDMSKEIQQLHNNLDGYAKDIDNLKTQSSKIKKLLEKAKEAEKRAKNLPDVQELKDNLKKANESQQRVTEALMKATDDLKTATASVSESQEKLNETGTILDNLMDSLPRLIQEINKLQEKTTRNRELAENATIQANASMQLANETDKEFQTLEDQFNILLKKLNRSQIPKEVLERIQLLKNETEQLTKGVEEKNRRLTALENRIDVLNKMKEEKKNLLKELEQQVINITQYIDEQQARYSTCT
ncbi:laminin subunit beta-4 isoform X2 [Protopterus annectens]|uniref:laminin subunit beta-4 isoform X2 n=1 Tax=Protopterus annectens TaxID=7888 RepID=UPI001CFA0AD3|nr:laminin subunit beta-4 isoform X2 [Protopterus annectens]